MSTTSQNNQVFDKSSPLWYPVLTDGTYDINQGDLLWYDASVHVVKPLDSDAHAAYFAGVALQQSNTTVYGTKTYPTGGVEVATQGIFKFKTITGDTLNHGDAVYFSTDGQTVTNTAGGMTHPIGYVWLKPGQSAVSGATGGSVLIEVMIAPVFPIVGGL
jgi:predicted RecA/RadA family phage recombinase